MEGYAHLQSQSLVDMLMCRGGQFWICSGAVGVNGGYILGLNEKTSTLTTYSADNS